MRLSIGQTKVIAAWFVKAIPTIFGASHTRDMFSDVFIAKAGSDLKTATSFDYYKISALKLTKWYKETRIQQHYGLSSTDNNTDYTEQLDLLKGMRYLTANSAGSYVDAANDPFLKQYIKHAHIDRAKAMKLLATDVKLPTLYIETYFGALPDVTSDTDVKIGNSLLFFPENVRPANIVTLTKLITNIYNDLKAKGLEKLFNKPVRFLKDMGNTLGTYYPQTKDIRIAYTASNDERTQFTILHEYGHKYFYEFIPEKIPDINNKYRELQRAGTNHSVSEEAKEKQDLVKELLSTLKVGDVMTSTTKKFAGDWTIVALSPQKVILRQQEHPMLQKRELSGNPAFLSTDRWTSKDPKIAEMMKYSKAKPKHEIVETEAWFPTKYSETNSSEWFAELFALHMSGKLKGDVAVFMKGLIK